MAYFHTSVLDNQIKALPTIGTASGRCASFTTDIADNIYDCVLDNSATTINRIGKNWLPNLKFQQSSQAVVLGWNAYAITTFLPAGTYTFSCDLTTAGTIYGRGANTSSPFAIYSSDGTTGHKTGTFITTEDNTYRVYVYNSQGIDASAITNFQIENGSLDTSYELYNIQTENASDWKNITTLNGINNIYADVGNISVDYLLSVGKKIS